MLHSLHLVFNKDISACTSEILRGAIISMTNHLDADIKDKINFHITDDKFDDTARKIPIYFLLNRIKTSFVYMDTMILEKSY